MRTNDSIAKFHALHSALTAERQALQQRLDRINTALGVDGPLPSMPTSVTRPSRSATRPNNALTLRESIAQITSQRPLYIRQIVQTLQKSGYKFTSTNPVNSVGAYLYGGGKKHFSRVNGKFSPKGASSKSVSASSRRTMSAQVRKNMAAAAKKRWAKVKGTAAGKAIASKRTMSPAARARISAAVKARWAKINAGKK